MATANRGQSFDINSLKNMLPYVSNCTLMSLYLDHHKLKTDQELPADLADFFEGKKATEKVKPSGSREGLGKVKYLGPKKSRSIGDNSKVGKREVGRILRDRMKQLFFAKMMVQEVVDDLEYLVGDWEAMKAREREIEDNLLKQMAQKYPGLEDFINGQNRGMAGKVHTDSHRKSAKAVANVAKNETNQEIKSRKKEDDMPPKKVSLKQTPDSGKRTIIESPGQGAKAEDVPKATTDDVSGLKTPVEKTPIDTSPRHSGSHKASGQVDINAGSNLNEGGRTKPKTPDKSTLTITDLKHGHKGQNLAIPSGKQSPPPEQTILITDGNQKAKRTKNSLINEVEPKSLIGQQVFGANTSLNADLSNVAISGINFHQNRRESAKIPPQGVVAPRVRGAQARVTRPLIGQRGLVPRRPLAPQISRNQPMRLNDPAPAPKPRVQQPNQHNLPRAKAAPPFPNTKNDKKAAKVAGEKRASKSLFAKIFSKN